MSLPGMRTVAGVATTVAALLLLRAASLAPVRDMDGDDAWLRLSWSARPERVEQCRRRTDAELAALPEHMRLRLECTGTFARYLLQLSVDGSVVRSDTVRGGGFRHDRPMHVLTESRVLPGRRRVIATLGRLDSAVVTPSAGSDATSPPAANDREAREHDEQLRRTEESIPPRLTLDTIVTLGRGDVLLITYNGVRRALEGRTGSP